MFLRSVRSTFARFLAILAITALGVGFFTGLKSSYPAMETTADDYLRRQHFSDFQLLSTLGFTQEDVEAFASLPGVAEAEGACFADLFGILRGRRDVYHLMSLPARTDLPVLTWGRMPETEDECLADSRVFGRKDVGRVITFAEDNDEEILATVKPRSVTIVGLARSPRYISSYRGDTSLGSGSVRAFLYLLPEAFDSEAYHELRLWCDLPGEIYSDEYAAARDRLKPEIEALLNSRAAARQAELKTLAEEKMAEAKLAIDNGRADYEAGKIESERKLDDALLQLEQAQAELVRGQREVDSGRAALEEGMSRIPAAREELEAARRDLESRREELASGRETLAASARELEAGEAELAQGRLQLEAYKAMTLEPYVRAVAAAEAQLLLTQAAINELADDPNASPAILAALQLRLTQRQAALEAARAELAAQATQFDAQEEELAAAERQLAEGRAQMEAAQAELDAGAAAIEEGFAQLEAAQAELDAAEAAYPERLRQLNEAQAQIDAGWTQLAEGREAYEQGRQEAAQELAEAEQKLLDAERELEEAAEGLEERLRLEVYALDRESVQGYRTFQNDIRIIDGLADVFPVFFTLVAALVCVTTMTRMVYEERTQIGTLKALGCREAAIMGKYLLYAGSASLLGCLLGFFLGTTMVPYIVWYAYGIIYEYAKLEFYFSPLMICLSTAVSVLGTLFVTWLACRRELREKPSELIRPRAPRSGRRILLEHLGPFWSRLPFLTKVSIRNAFRYPLRVWMMLLGIGGCTALMVAGFGARDSIARIAEYQFNDIYLYDISVSLDTDKLPPENASALWDDTADRFALVRQEPVTVSFAGREMSTRVTAAEQGALDGVIRISDAEGDLPFPAPGEIVVTEKIAEKLGLSVGDRLELKRDDGESVELAVSGLCRNYLGHGVYVDAASLAECRMNTALLCLPAWIDAGEFGAGLRSQAGVTYVSLSAAERETVERSMASIDLVVLLVVVCSAALALITVYDLTNINLLERMREVATVKVLGFLPWESASYILSENVLLSVLGAAIGLLLGKQFHAVVIHAIVVDYMSYDVRIAPWSYVLSFAATIAFTLLTNLLMLRRLDGINMAESLKSIE